MNKENRILKAFFTSDTRIDVLAYVFSHPGESFYHNQLQKVFGKQNSQLHRELLSMEDAGFLISSKEGNQKRYTVNSDFPLFNELKSIFLKTAGAGNVLKEALAPASNQIKAAFIFGSFASGEAAALSDIDLMIIGDVTLSDISSLISPVEEKLSREINPSVYSSVEFKTKLDERNNFISNIMDSEKIFLIGDGDALNEISD